ncbi:MAG: cation transporting ATPase C-terminal domain-containing protein [Gemmataceae bacterium]|nr:cation transporting ATPase C-terminal domain-containing protein [Gemmataceae bacterium]
MSTALLLGLMLVFEAKEPNIMRRPPRHPHAPLLNRPLIMRTLFVSLLILAGVFAIYQWLLGVRQVPPEVARAAAVNMVVFVQLFYLFNCRCLTHSMLHVGLFSNAWVWWGAATMALCQLLLTHLAPLNTLFHLGPLTADVWALIILYGLLVYALIELEKAFVGPWFFGPVWTPQPTLPQPT